MNKNQSWFNEYKASLKNIHAEEPLDIYLYRPIAFIIVKLCFKLPLTPNHYSLMALFSGIISGYYFLQGAYLIGALYFFLFAVLDCADGMQARLKKNGSEFGRIIDGAVDYTVNVIVYLGLAIGMTRFHDQVFYLPIWALILLAGISKAIHSMVYDHFLTEYLSYEKGHGSFAIHEIELLEKRIVEARIKKESLVKRFALNGYLLYTKLQNGKEEKILKYNQNDYRLHNLHTLRLWSLLGPANHITALVIAFIFNMPNLFYFYSLIFANLWLVLMFAYQYQTNKKLEVLHQ